MSNQFYLATRDIVFIQQFGIAFSLAFATVCSGSRDTDGAVSTGPFVVMTGELNSGHTRHMHNTQPVRWCRAFRTVRCLEVFGSVWVFEVLL